MRITRRDLLRSGVATGAALMAQGALARGTAAEARRPNIVMIMADDIGFECYGAYGSQQYQTPRFDALAQSGAQFTQAFAQPVCTPSRLQLMTGKHNFRNYTGFGTMDLSEPTFAKLLRDAGYRTCIAGKWQLSPEDLTGPEKAGFDAWLLWHFQTIRREGEGEAPEEFLDKGSRYKSPKLYRNGTLLENTEGNYGPDLVVDFIEDFMEEHREEPFLVYYPMILVHDPFEPTPDSVDWETGGKDPRYFPDMVRYMDKCIGRVVDKLDALGLRENTLILVTGDNGTNVQIASELPGVGTIQGGKRSMTDAGTHVAFAASWPGRIPAGTKVATPIDFTDVLPTMAEAAGLEKPSYADGQSLLPICAGDESKARGWVFMSYADERRQPLTFRYFVRDQRWKLYDVAADRLEEHPVTTEESKPIRERLQAIMDEMLGRETQAEKGA